MEEIKRKEAADQTKEVSRGDFLKMAGITGLGIAGLGAVMGSIATAAEEKEGKKKKYLFVITAGSNDPNRAFLSLLLAETVLKKEFGDVMIYFALEGAEFSKKGAPEKIVSLSFNKFGNGLEMMERIRKYGGTFGVCPPCADRMGAVGENRIDWIENQDGVWLTQKMQECIVSWL